MASHLLYLDDAGAKEPTLEPLAGTTATGNARYCCFGAVLCEPAAASSLSREIEDLKIHDFAVPDVEIQSSQFRIPHERKPRYVRVQPP